MIWQYFFLPVALIHLPAFLKCDVVFDTVISPTCHVEFGVTGIGNNFSKMYGLRNILWVLAGVMLQQEYVHFYGM